MQKEAEAKGFKNSVGWEKVFVVVDDIAILLKAKDSSQIYPKTTGNMAQRLLALP